MNQSVVLVLTSEVVRLNAVNPLFVSREFRSYSVQARKTLATENNILSTRAMQRRVIEELTPTGEWSIIVSKRRAFVRLLKKP